MITTQSTHTVLVVEDDPSISSMIALALDEAGYDVYTARTVGAAIRICYRVSPDLIVADLLLPDGLGTELIGYLRVRYDRPLPPALMISAHPRARERGEAVGIDAYLSKPFDLDEFYSVVARLTEDDSSQRE